VGAFRVIKERKTGAIVAKEGGNVALYFCTPEGQVLSAVAGAETARVVLEEAQRAVAIAAQAAALGGDRDEALRATAVRVHRGLLPRKAGRRPIASVSDHVTRLLAASPAPALDGFARTVWEQVLGQTVSDAAVEVLEVDDASPYREAFR